VASKGIDQWLPSENGKTNTKHKSASIGKAHQRPSQALPMQKKCWARRLETKAEASSISIKKYQPANFAEVLQTYLEKVTPLKRNTTVEAIIIGLLMRSD